MNHHGAKEDDAMEQAKAEWEKFDKVAVLLNTVNDYLAIYDQLKESGELVVVGSFGDRDDSRAANGIGL